MRYWRSILLLAIVLLMAGFAQSWVFAWVFYLVAGLLLVALAIAWRPAQLLNSSRNLTPAHTDIDQPVTVRVALAWSQPVRVGWVLAHDTIPPALRVISPAGRLFAGNETVQTEFSYRCSAPRRGYYPLGPLAITSGDLFGIAQANSLQTSHDYLTVYPRVVPVPDLRLASNRPIGNVRSEKRIFEDPIRIIGVRDYEPGDSLAHVHWKATARSGKLASKVLEPSTSVEIDIVLNFHQGDYPSEDFADLACTATASLAAQLLADKSRVGIQSNGADATWEYEQVKEHSRFPIAIKAVRDQAQLTTILATLARLRLSAQTPLSRYLSEVHARLTWSATVLLITHGLSEEAGQSLESLKRAGFSLAVIVVGTGDLAEEARGRAASLGIPVASVQTEEHLAILEFWQPGR